MGLPTFHQHRAAPTYTSIFCSISTRGCQIWWVEAELGKKKWKKVKVKFIAVKISYQKSCHFSVLSNLPRYLYIPDDVPWFSPSPSLDFSSNDSSSIRKTILTSHDNSTWLWIIRIRSSILASQTISFSMTTSRDSVVIMSLESTRTLNDCSGHTFPDSNSLDFAQL